MNTSPEAIAAVRRFSRFYTHQLGLLDEHLLQSEFSLTEARVLYELATRDGLTASVLCRDLALDAGYLSRILKAFEQRGLLGKTPSQRDKREMVLTLTQKGRAAFAPLNEGSSRQVGALLDRIGTDGSEALLTAMQTVERLMAPRSRANAYQLRPPRLGDIGWIIHRQAILYQQEYGWDATFEVLLAEIFAQMMRRFDVRSDRGWIAERDGETVGSVFVVRVSEEVAKLRLLYVEPSARGLGIGRRLVKECIAFARETGYKTLTLWTNDVLVPARRIYQQCGFQLAAEERVHQFGNDMVSETWNLVL